MKKNQLQIKYKGLLETMSEMIQKLDDLTYDALTVAEFIIEEQTWDRAGLRNRSYSRQLRNLEALVNGQQMILIQLRELIK